MRWGIPSSTASNKKRYSEDFPKWSKQILQVTKEREHFGAAALYRRPAHNILTKVVFLRIINDGYAAAHIAGPALEPRVLADPAASCVCAGIQLCAACQGSGI